MHLVTFFVEKVGDIRACESQVLQGVNQCFEKSRRISCMVEEEIGWLLKCNWSRDFLVIIHMDLIEDISDSVS